MIDVAFISTLAYSLQLKSINGEERIVEEKEETNKPHICVRIINKGKSILNVPKWDLFDYLTAGVIVGAIAKYKNIQPRHIIQKVTSSKSRLTTYIEELLKTIYPSSKATALFPLITILVYRKACRQYPQWMNSTALWGFFCLPALRQVTGSKDTGLSPLLILVSRQLLFLDEQTRENKRRLLYMAFILTRSLLTRHTLNIWAHLAVLVPAFAYSLKKQA
mmetsp:Transcript_7240/g.10651  ORF Transcript_7240/g.10651 Transcript_7240/m.10651 type:complete len:220 (-) Transcript_7240:2105-2764(-)